MPTAFKATYSDWKLVKTRGVVQIVFEVPLAEADSAYELLGGMPIVANERWFGIAALKPEEARATPRQEVPPSTRPDGAKRKPWETLLPQQQAAMRSGEPIFATFLKENHPDEWHETTDANECLKLICGVASKRDLELNHKARMAWKQLDDQFQAWKALEHA